MSKMLISSLSLQAFLEKIDTTLEEYTFAIAETGFNWNNKVCEGYGIRASDEIAYMRRPQLEDFIAILNHLQDQPILIRIYAGRLWLMEAVV